MLEYLVQKGDVQRALALLRRPDVSQELFYKFAPGLIPLAPGETVNPSVELPVKEKIALHPARRPV